MSFPVLIRYPRSFTDAEFEDRLVEVIADCEFRMSPAYKLERLKANESTPVERRKGEKRIKVESDNEYAARKEMQMRALRNLRDLAEKLLKSREADEAKAQKFYGKLSS